MILNVILIIFFFIPSFITVLFTLVNRFRVYYIDNGPTCSDKVMIDWSMNNNQ